MKRTELLLLTIIFFFAFVFRLYRFDGPIADWHSWRQADTSAVSRNFVKYGFDVLHPRFDDLSNVPSGKDNPMGYRFVEFPIYNVLQAGLFRVFDFFTIEEWGRLVTIGASLLSTWFIFGIVRRHFGAKTAFLSAFFFAFLPYNIYYSRTILPDPSMVTASLGGVYFFDLWINKKPQFANYYFLLSLLFTTAAFLIKPYALFFTVPILYITWEKFGLHFLKKWQLWIYLFVSITPLVLWRIWMMQYPEGIPVSAWLFNGNGIRFRPAFFRWIFHERITKLISGYFGVIFIVAALLHIVKNKGFGLVLSFLFSSMIYLFVIATGNVQHDYYQILIIPTLAILYGIGARYLMDLKYTFLSVPIGKLSVVVITVVMFSIGWNFAKDYFNINNRSIMVAGGAVDKLTPINAKVIALYNGDTSFLYQTKRQGWTSFQKSLPEMITMGAEYLVIANPTPADLDLAKTYKAVGQSSQYLLLDLKKTQ